MDWETFNRDIKNYFINSLTENNVIVDERFMIYDGKGFPSLQLDNYAFLNENGEEIKFLPNINKAREYSLVPHVIDMWNNKAKEYIKKIDNMEKLIKKI